VSKRFCRSLKRSLWYGLQDLGSEIGGGRHGGGSGLPQSSADVPLRPDEFWAVKDVSFELRRGECLGLIGRNGAGKTTLLRMLNGLIKPDTGHIEMKGRVGALIALGAGFNPLLTGKENIYTNASVLGISKSETEAYIEKIVEFSELEDFIDTPVQSYSSGMQVRLGFAVAAILMRPDILILDEVLAVGDARFQVKCVNIVQQLLTSGTAAVFVSHNTHEILRYCNKGLLLSRQGNQHGDIKQTLASYQSSNYSLEKTTESGAFEQLYSTECCKVMEITPCQVTSKDKELGIDVKVYFESTDKSQLIKMEVAADGLNEGCLLSYMTDNLITNSTEKINTYRLKWRELPLRATLLTVGIVIWDCKSNTKLAWAKRHSIAFKTQARHSLLTIEPQLEVLAKLAESKFRS
jgi:ABC-type polysaccharide/polyol phosphate transport system ATPase subunit